MRLIKVDRWKEWLLSFLVEVLIAFLPDVRERTLCSLTWSQKDGFSGLFFSFCIAYGSKKKGWESHSLVE
jgi:hypothetical protein